MAEQKDVLFGFYADSPALQQVVQEFTRPAAHIGLPAGPGITAAAGTKR